MKQKSFTLMEKVVLVQKGSFLVARSPALPEISVNKPSELSEGQENLPLKVVQQTVALVTFLGS